MIVREARVYFVEEEILMAEEQRLLGWDEEEEAERARAECGQEAEQAKKEVSA